MTTNIYQSFTVPVSVSNDETGMALNQVSLWVSQAPAGAQYTIEIHRLDMEYSGAQIDSDFTRIASASGFIQNEIRLTTPATSGKITLDFTVTNTILKQGARYAINFSSSSAVRLFSASVGEESLVNPGRLITSSVLADGSTFTINNLSVVNEYGQDLMFEISTSKYVPSATKVFRLKRSNTYKIVRIALNSIFDVKRLKVGDGVINTANPLTPTETMPTIVALAYTGGATNNEFKAIIEDPDNKLNGTASPTYHIEIRNSQQTAIRGAIVEFLTGVNYDALEINGLVEAFESSDVEVQFLPFTNVEPNLGVPVEFGELQLFEGFNIGGALSMPSYRPNVDENERFRVTLKTENQYVSPSLHSNELKVRLGTKLIPTPEAVDLRREILGVNAATARYQSMPIQLAVGQEAEDLIVMASAEVPQGTRLIAFSRFLSPEDSNGSLSSRLWSPMVLQAWPANPFDGTRRDYRWSLPTSLIEAGPVTVEDYPFVYETLVDTVNGSNVITVVSPQEYTRMTVNGWGIGDVVESDSLPAGTVVQGLNPTTYRITVSNPATATAEESARFFISQNGSTYGWINKGDDDSDHEIDFSGVARYTYNFGDATPTLYYGIRSFQFKIIMLAETGVLKYPKLYDVRAIALQA